MTRAQLFVENYRADQGDVLHIYDDGFVLMVACSGKRHLAIRELLRNRYPTVEEARSSDGFQSAFVIPVNPDELGTPSEIANRHSACCVLSTHFNDHRWDDWHTLENAEAMAERMQSSKSSNKLSDGQHRHGKDG